MFVERLPGNRFDPLHASINPNVVTDAQHAALTSADQELAEYIRQGPLLHSCGISPDSIVDDFSKWRILGDRLAFQLGFDANNLDNVQRLRIYHYYLPVFFWVNQQLEQHRAKHVGAPTTPALVVGISAPQGCGKSTLVEQLEQLFDWLGQHTATVSVDDFYLTNKDQNQLAADFKDNKLLQYRGNAGSHDLQLGTTTLESLRALTQEGQSVAVPRYDKSAFQGRGDRADPSTWPSVKGPLQLVLFEGWMLGFRPLADGRESAAAVDGDLVEVDRRLRAYEEAWDSHVDAWLVIRVGDPQWVYNWRLQAEEKMIAAGKPGMSTAQIQDFVARFMPAYAAYLPELYMKGPTTAKAGRTLVVEVDQRRSPVVPQPEPIL